MLKYLLYIMNWELFSVNTVYHDLLDVRKRSFELYRNAEHRSSRNAQILKNLCSKYCSILVTRAAKNRNPVASKRIPGICRPHLRPCRHQPKRVCQRNPSGLQSDVCPHANHGDVFFWNTGGQEGAYSKRDSAKVLHFGVVRTALDFGRPATALETGALPLCPACHHEQQWPCAGSQPGARTGQSSHLLSTHHEDG